MFLLCGWVLCAFATRASAEPLPVHGTAHDGLPGLYRVGSPLSTPGLNLSASAGYGLQGVVEPAGGKHPRAIGGFSAALALQTWLAFALRLDGRIDFHAGEEGGAYTGAVGEPRLLVRTGTPLSDAFSLGTELSAFLPGRKAPSVDLAATSVDGRGLLAFAPPRAPFSLLASCGFRLDNSAHSAPDLARLRAGDRVGLGLSEFDALLLGVGGAYRFGARVESFAELSGDVLLGSGAPGFAQSPLRAALGGRYFLSRALQAELVSIVSLSERPAIAQTDRLLPIEPRFSIIAAVRYGWSLGGPSATRPSVSEGPPAPVTAELSGTLSDPAGQPLPEARVSLRTRDGEQHETISDAYGRYRFSDVAVGPAQLDIEAVGFAPLQRAIDVRRNMPVQAMALTPASASSGVVRGLIRSFRSEPLSAQIEVRSQRGNVVASAQSDASGRFELTLPAGRYQITISAARYRVQRRDVEVVQGGVVILNADMRER